MPFTFLAHQAPVLPLKLAAPRRWDGTGLAVGSMVPDLAYSTMGTPFYVPAHDLTAQVWFCLPVGMAATVLVKRLLAPVVAAHLPDLGVWHVHDWAALGRWPAGRGWRAWLVLAVSVLVGAVSHVVLDSFTHGHGWVVRHVALMDDRVAGIKIYNWLQVGLSFVGALAALAMLRWAGSRRLVRDAYGPPPLRATGASERILRAGMVLALAAGLIVMFLTLDRGTGTALMLRPVVVAGVTLGAACGYARRGMVPVPADPARP